MTEVSGLNALRGVAAVLVMFSHARPFVMADFNQLSATPGPAMKAFYLLTGLGTSSVMVFFVLSGFLIGASVHNAYDRGRWSWGGYGISRLTRLWTTLIPCLLLTALVDQVAIAFFSPDFYIGNLSSEIASAPQPPVDLSLQAFLGNVAFIQLIVVPVYGSNGPLWSIALEAWYYVMFPLLFFTVVAAMDRRFGRALVLGAIVAAMIVFVGPGVTFLFAIWLAGYGVWTARNSRLWAILSGSVPLVILAILILASAVLGVRVAGIQGGNLGYSIVGVATVIALPAFHSPLFNAVRRGADALSNISYSLYLSNFPVLALMSSMMGNWRTQDPLVGIGLFLLACAISIFVAVLVWYLAERHHKAVRIYCMQFVMRSRVALK